MGVIVVRLNDFLDRLTEDNLSYCRGPFGSYQWLEFSDGELVVGDTNSHPTLLQFLEHSRAASIDLKEHLTSKSDIEAIVQRYADRVVCGGICNSDGVVTVTTTNAFHKTMPENRRDEIERTLRPAVRKAFPPEDDPDITLS